MATASFAPVQRTSIQREGRRHFAVFGWSFCLFELYEVWTLPSVSRWFLQKWDDFLIYVRNHLTSMLIQQACFYLYVFVLSPLAIFSYLDRKQLPKMSLCSRVKMKGCFICCKSKIIIVYSDYGVWMFILPCK